MLPAVFHFLTTFKPDVIAITPDANSYLDFVLAIFFAFGASFELPVALVILVLMGWVSPKQLSEGRGYAIVGIFVLAAVLTPGRGLAADARHPDVPALRTGHHRLTCRGAEGKLAPQDGCL